MRELTSDHPAPRMLSHTLCTWFARCAKSAFDKRVSLSSPLPEDDRIMFAVPKKVGRVGPSPCSRPPAFSCPSPPRHAAGVFVRACRTLRWSWLLCTFSKLGREEHVLKSRSNFCLRLSFMYYAPPYPPIQGRLAAKVLEIVNVRLPQPPWRRPFPRCLLQPRHRHPVLDLVVVSDSLCPPCQTPTPPPTNRELAFTMCGPTGSTLPSAPRSR